VQDFVGPLSVVGNSTHYRSATVTLLGGAAAWLGEGD
jgi:hypothetical protein